jgi:hypothetical protein
MKSPLLVEDPTFEREVAGKRPIPLYSSTTQALPFALMAALILVIGGAFRGWEISVAAGALGLGLVGLVMNKRLDVDADGLTLVPVLVARIECRCSIEIFRRADSAPGRSGLVAWYDRRA